jgi:predicted transposase YbfD/YdcC
MQSAEETFEQLKNIFSALDDPRDPRGTRHDLVEVITIAILAAVCGCDDAEAIEGWALTREKFLRKFLRLRHGVPSQDTFLRVFARLSPHQFNAAFMRWTQSILPDVVDAHIAVDGKCVRGSHDRAVGLHPIHMVSAYVVGAGLTLAQLKVDTKTNETKAIVDLLGLLELKNTTTTIDAAGCYQEVAQAITDGGGDFVLAVKENQPTLYADLKRAFEERGTTHPKRSTQSTVEKGHGRLEKRTITLSSSMEWISDADKWWSVKCFFKVETERTILSEGTTTIGTRYFIASKSMTTEQALNYVRGHWAIENQVHWWLDVVANDDSYRGRYGYTPQNMSKLKRLALNILKTAPPLWKNGASLRMKRQQCALSQDYLLKVLHAALQPAD